MVAFWMVAMLAGSPVTAANAGNCEPPGPEAGLSALGEVVDDAAASLDGEAARIAARTERFIKDPTTAACVGQEHSHRTYAEDKELQKIEQQVKKEVDEICKKNVCTSNLGYGLLVWNPWIPVFGGCSNWALAATDAVGQPSYFDKRREQRCVVAPVCHFVVVLTNPRTGEEHIIDAWGYAGGWSGKNRRKGSVFSSRSALNGKFPNEWWIDNQARGRCTRNERNDR